MLGNFSWFCFHVVFFKINLLENSFRNTIRVSNSLDPDQARHFVRPDLGPKCLPKFSADDNGCKELINEGKCGFKLLCYSQ